MTSMKVNILWKIMEKIKLLPSQREFMESASPELMFSGAFGAGKTRILCEKAFYLSAKYPNNFGLIVRKTFNSLKHTTLRSLLKGTSGPPAIPFDAVENHNRTDHIITLRNGSEIVYGGIDTPEKWGSLEVGWIAIDEGIEIGEDDYNMLIGRLRLRNVPFRQIFTATNPAIPGHFLYRRFYESPPVDSNGNRLTHVIESNSLSNTYLPSDYIEKLKSFRGRYYDRYVLGKWISFEGLVYDLFDPLIHVIDPFIIPESFEKICSIDFGYTNPFVCQFWAISPDNEWFLYREIYHSHRLVEDHAVEIKKWVDKEKIKYVFVDHDAEDKATLESRGIRSDNAEKSISPGIQETYSKFRTSDSEKSKIYFFRNAVVEKDQYLAQQKKPLSTVEEIQQYVWNNKNEKDIPIKKNDHGCDAMRYAIYSYSKMNEKESGDKYGVITW